MDRKEKQEESDKKKENIRWVSCNLNRALSVMTLSLKVMMLVS